MRNAIIRGIYEVAYTPVRLLDWLSKAVKWLADRFDGVACWVWTFRKAAPRHRITFPDPKAQERYHGPIHRLNLDVAEPEDWLPATPFVKQDACPECGSDEFPLTVYDGLRMCPVCKDEAVITDKTFGHTGPQSIPGWPHLVG